MQKGICPAWHPSDVGLTERTSRSAWLEYFVSLSPCFRVRPNHKRYLLALLTAILVVNYSDRLVFGVVLQDIKRDLALSDTQLGVLTGIAFGSVYALAGLPWRDGPTG